MKHLFAGKYSNLIVLGAHKQFVLAVVFDIAKCESRNVVACDTPKQLVPVVTTIIANKENSSRK